MNISLRNQIIYKTLVFLFTLYLVISIGPVSCIAFLVLFLIIMYILMVFKSDNFFIVSVVILSLLSYSLSQYSQIGSYIPTILTLLLLAKTLLNLLRRGTQIEMRFNMSFLIFSLIIFDFIAMIVTNVDTNYVLIVYAMLKKYSFFIMLLFVYNSDCDNGATRTITRILTYSCYLNFIIILFQSKNGITGDYLNGFFGYKANGIVLQSFCFAIVGNMNNKKRAIISKIHFLILSILLLIYSSIAEVKAGFIILFVILLVNFIIHIKKIRSLVLMLSFLLIFNFAYSYLVQLYPTMDFMSKGFMQKYLTESYTRDKTISRINYMNALDKTVIHNSFEWLFGHGSGSLNDNKGVLKGGLIDKYGDMKIQWFSTPYLIVENGVVGLAIILLIYLSYLVRTTKYYIRYKEPKYFQLLQMIIVSIIMLLMYSQMTNIYGCIYLLWVYIGIYMKKLPDKELGYDKESKRLTGVYT